MSRSNPKRYLPAMGVLALILLVVGFSSVKTANALSQLAADGEPKTAVVLDKSKVASMKKRKRGKRNYRVELQVQGMQEPLRFRVDKTEYERTEVGAQAAIVQSPTDPRHLYIGTPDELKRKLEDRSYLLPLGYLASVAGLGLGAFAAFHLLRRSA